MQTNILKLIFTISFILQCIGQTIKFCDDYHYYKDDKSKRLITLYHANHTVKKCDEYHKLTSGEDNFLRIGGFISSCLTTIKRSEEFEQVKKLCPTSKKKDVWTGIFWKPKGRTVPLIAPGTLWCGKGNIASSYDELGTNWEIDSCCRDHDHCQFTILSGETKFGVHNDHFYTISHCDCDGNFYRCLKSVRKVGAAAIGAMYFNTFAIPCVKLDHPIVRCRRINIYNKKCQEYSLDLTSPQIWQLFDPQYYD